MRWCFLCFNVRACAAQGFRILASATWKLFFEEGPLHHPPIIPLTSNTLCLHMRFSHSKRHRRRTFHHNSQKRLPARHVQTLGRRVKSTVLLVSDPADTRRWNVWCTDLRMTKALDLDSHVQNVLLPASVILVVTRHVDATLNGVFACL